VTWRRFLLVPQLAAAGLRPAPPPERAWESYWSGVTGTGPGGDVLWDGAHERELRWWQETARLHLDPALPLVDVGCGNGRVARLLAGHFPSVLGVDVSQAAVDLAVRESDGVPGVSFRCLDMTAPGAGAALARETGSANVVLRGVLHVLGTQQRRAVVANLEQLVGPTGSVLLLETAFEGDSLSYLHYLGGTHRGLPAPVARLIQERLPKPRHVGPAQLADAFPAARWSTVAQGAVDIGPVQLPNRSEDHVIPGHHAVLRRAVPVA
jgi:SAM-dependent methyltransferase